LGIGAGAQARHLVAMDAERLAGEPLPDLTGAGRLADALGQGLAFLAGELAAELFLAGQDLGADLVQDLRADLRAGARPGVERLLRRADRVLDLLRAGRGIGADRVGLVRRVLVQPRALALDPLAGDPIALQFHVHGPLRFSGKLSDDFGR